MNDVTLPTQVLDSLHDLIQTYRFTMRTEMHTHDPRLTRNTVRCLLFVGHQPLCTHKALMEHLHADKAQVARILMEMEANEWIERVPHPEDKRSRTLKLSPQGEQLFSNMRATRARIGLHMLQDCPETEQAHLLALLQQMRTNLQAVAPAGDPQCGAGACGGASEKSLCQS